MEEKNARICTLCDIKYCIKYAGKNNKRFCPKCCKSKSNKEQLQRMTRRGWIRKDRRKVDN